MAEEITYYAVVDEYSTRAAPGGVSSGESSTMTAAGRSVYA